FSRFDLFVVPLRGTDGAIGALLTVVDPHTAQITSPASACSSKVALFLNHASNTWVFSHLRSYLIICKKR
ncbi:hypothetical protein, partial [uncultured Sneathiella sp.]|uniref:hypothetical protein n=1 Tax=uncultured Sneathiella sp. TaxID=879315 RepID=UPI0030DC1636